MPRRNIVIAPDQIYHVYNKSIASEEIFQSAKEYLRTLDVINYYRFSKPTLRYSHYNRLPLKEKSEYIKNLEKNKEKIVEIIAFCLMPNHYHFLLRNKTKGGISNFIRNIQISYAKYFNLKQDREGSLFRSMFKAKRIETENQLLHVSRYIHLNPLTSYVIKLPVDLAKYQMSSYFDYLGNREFFVDKRLILSFFKTREALKKFTMDQVDYQRKLKQIKDLLFE